VVLVILTRFPQPSGAILKALELLAISRDGDPDEMAEAGDLSELPRPWEPASCPDELRARIWHWCDSVAGWLNTDLAWRPAQIIPDCWPRHPHLARELPILAILRWQAEEALDPRWLEEWHRYTYPAFLDRLAVSLGESTCRAGKHQDWPARARVSAFLRGAEQRLRFLQADAASTPDSTSRFG
jgi:hypothetical protein